MGMILQHAFCANTPVIITDQCKNLIAHLDGFVVSSHRETMNSEGRILGSEGGIRHGNEPSFGRLLPMRNLVAAFGLECLQEGLQNLSVGVFQSEKLRARRV